ncbi:MAG: GNAT family N-acetyltransferase [Bacilli bacterium]|nr:GNAT family N-acetyltransferase [Bacilli bacterium]
MIETERLILRPYKENDAEFMFKNWTHDDEVSKYVTWNTHQSIEETKQILHCWLEQEKERITHRFCITIKGSDEPIGAIDIADYIDGKPEIGYVLSRKYWNQGIMTEACKAFIKHLFLCGFYELLIAADERNIGSNRVIMKCGFTFTHKETRICSSVKPWPITVNWYKLTR